MSIDTVEKRFSMLNFGDGANIHLLFQSDGAIDLDDRQHLLDCYSGISFSGSEIPPFFIAATGNSSGTSTVTGISLLNFGDGNSSGIATVTGIVNNFGNGNSSGIATVSAESIANNVGVSTGISTVSGFIEFRTLIDQWKTNAGTLGTFNEREFVTTKVEFESVEGRTVTYSLQSGKLPKGLKLDSTTGIISGTPFDVDLDTQTKFTIRVSDVTDDA